TPCNYKFLNQLDLDLGSAGPMLVPDTPPRIISGGKEGILYVLSPTNMGSCLQAVDRDIVVLGKPSRAIPGGICSPRLVMAIGCDEHFSIGHQRRGELGEQAQPVALGILFARPQCAAHIMRIERQHNTFYTALLVGVAVKRDNSPYHASAGIVAVGGNSE